MGKQGCRSYRKGGTDGQRLGGGSRSRAALVRPAANERTLVG
ncbi:MULTISPECIES: hypothetical protein [unclassified Micromonospora]|nr:MULTISPECIES: hypothetical protein [unclassified Micromonospora]MCZ7419972.1 hypothetical protein [Verrucosispora sp. WMMA2121]WBB89489.1 hypothetical protein O7597_21095 [Verrucosispora sp. WMMC514]